MSGKVNVLSNFISTYHSKPTCFRLWIILSISLQTAKGSVTNPHTKCSSKYRVRKHKKLVHKRKRFCKVIRMDALYMTQYSLKCLADSWGLSLSSALVSQWRSSWRKVRWWDYRVAGGSKMPARNNSGIPGTRLPLSLFVPCWSRARSHVWGRTGRAPDKNRTSLWNGPGYGQSQYETAERVKTVTYSRIATVIWHTQQHTVTVLLELTGTALRHTAAGTDMAIHTTRRTWLGSVQDGPQPQRWCHKTYGGGSFHAPWLSRGS